MNKYNQKTFFKVENVQLKKQTENKLKCDASFILFIYFFYIIRFPSYG